MNREACMGHKGLTVMWGHVVGAMVQERVGQVLGSS